MSVIEKVAVSLWRGDLERTGTAPSVVTRRTLEAFADIGPEERGKWLALARAALTALLEGVEPVAWRFLDPNGGDVMFAHTQQGYWQDKCRRNGATETPLYDLTKLREALK